MPKPFLVDPEARAELTRLAKPLLTHAHEAAKKTFAGRKVEQIGPLPNDATLSGRHAISTILQALYAECADQGIGPFDFFDGVAHGVAVILAQAPVGASIAVQDMMAGQIRGYETRTRALMP